MHCRQTQLALLLHRERPDRRDKLALGLLRYRLIKQIRQPGFEIGKQHVELRGGHIRLVEIQQRVVGGAAFYGRTQLRLFTTELDHLFKIGGKTFPVIRRALATPGVLAAAARQRFRLYQRLRKHRRLLIVAGHLPQVGLLNVVEILLRGRFKPLSHLFIRQDLVFQDA